MRWLLLDSFNFIDLENGGRAQARRAITRAEDFFSDHFHIYPILPSTLQIEMIAQTGGVLVGAAVNFEKEVILAKIDWARFPKEVIPPAVLVIDAWITERRDEGTRIEGKITNEGSVVCEASILLAHVDRLETGLAQSGESIVFTQDFLHSYRIKEMVGAKCR